jgi:hypothetical protein
LHRGTQHGSQALDVADGDVQIAASAESMFKRTDFDYPQVRFL